MYGYGIVFILLIAFTSTWAKDDPTIHSELLKIDKYESLAYGDLAQVIEDHKKGS